MKDLINQALKVMEEEFKGGQEKLGSSKLTQEYCRLQIGAEKDEVFAVLFLDNQLRMLSFERFFNGTINQSSVFMRPIARKMLELNAAKMVLVHNHPSGVTNPSQSDIDLTKAFKKVFDALDCQIVDHVIVSPVSSFSFAEQGVDMA